MSAHLNYDTDLRVVFVITAPTDGTLTLDAQIDIFSDMKEDWKDLAALKGFKFPLFEPVGGNVIQAGKKISPFYFLKFGWKMRPYEGDHTLYIANGYLLTQGGGDPWIKTTGGFTVNIRDLVPTDSFSLVGTPAEVGAAVWNTPKAAHTDKTTFGGWVGKSLLTFVKFFSTK